MCTQLCMCMYICMCMHIMYCICMYICMCMCMYIRMCMYMCTCVCVCTYHVCVCTYVVYAHVYVRTYNIVHIMACTDTDVLLCGLLDILFLCSHIPCKQDTKANAKH